MNKIDQIVREFYAQYGHAIHNAQILERKSLELYAIKKINGNLIKQYYIY